VKGWGWIVGGVVLAVAATAATRLRWPLDSVYITDAFGTPRAYGPHNGVDLRAPIGTPVYAPGDGEVIETDTSATSGRYMVLAIENGNEVLRAGFAHLSNWVAREGSRVLRGDLVAYTGNTGTHDPHLHYTLKRGDTWLNPATFHA
jgi:murein DD-endopeptidase MepM/ murein hydrolase activator NlpD